MDFSRISARSERLSALILYAGLAGPPFLFGSRDPTTIGFWCALLGVGLILAPTRRLRGPHVAVLFGLALVGICFGFVLHEQLSDHPWVAEFNPIWAKASEALGQPIQPLVSIVRGEPWFALGAPLANSVALVLGLLIGVDSDRARRGLKVMAWAGVGYAVYGIFSLLVDPTTILWREKTAYVGNLTATFINRNTAAAYFGSCAVVWFGLLLESVRGRLPRGPIEWREVPQHLLGDTHLELIIRFVMLFVCLAAMFLTSSRGGTLVSLLALMLTFVIYFRRDLPRGRKLLFALLGVGVVALLVLQVMGSNIGGRIDLQGLSDAGRLSAWRSTLRIIADNPWFGTGLGTFAWSFPAYRSDDISMYGVWDIAHNTYLEFASEVGIPLTVVTGLAWLVGLGLLIYGLRGRRRDSLVSLSALMVCMIALLHSSIDFSLQIAGYAIVVFALLGLGLAQALRADVEAEGKRQRRSHRRKAISASRATRGRQPVPQDAP